MTEHLIALTNWELEKLLDLVYEHAQMSSGPDAVATSLLFKKLTERWHEDKHKQIRGDDRSTM